MLSEAKHPYRYIKLIATQPLDKKHRPASLPAFNLTDLDPYSLAVWADGLRPLARNTGAGLGRCAVDAGVTAA